MEQIKFFSTVTSIAAHSFLALKFSRDIVVGVGLWKTLSFRMLQRFSTGLRFGGHSSFGKNPERLSEHHACVTLAVCAGAPSCMNTDYECLFTNFRLSGRTCPLPSSQCWQQITCQDVLDVIFSIDCGSLGHNVQFGEP